MQNLDPLFGPLFEPPSGPPSGPPRSRSLSEKKNDLVRAEATFVLSEPKTNMLTNKNITFNCTARHFILKNAMLDQLRREFSYNH